MQRFTFKFLSYGDSAVRKEIEILVDEPVSVQQLIENFFLFLEATGVDAETVENATSDVLMDRFSEEDPFELSDDDTIILGIGA